MNQCAFKHSVRNLPLNDSMKALSVGFPGREKSSVTPFWYATGLDRETQTQNATIFFRLPFSSSSWRSRFISDGINPAYFLRQL